MERTRRSGSVETLSKCLSIQLFRSSKFTSLEKNEYVAVKLYISTPAGRTNREQLVYERLSKITSSHPGQSHVRQALDSFDLIQRNGAQHYCIVHQPLHTTIYDFQRLYGKPRPLPESLVKDVLRCLLQGLDFLHREGSIVHCDIKLSNILLEVGDPSVLAGFEKAERATPSKRKIIDEERAIYASRKFQHPQKYAFGPPVLCDFGEARIGTSFPWENIQPEVYKAPEILMQMDWDHSVDIWNVACVVWDMLQLQHLFDGYDDEGYHNNRVHIGEIVGLLGHPSQRLQRRSPHAWRVFDEHGRWKNNPPLSPSTLDDREKHLTGESKAPFLAFIRSMLRWQPEERKTARQLLDEDPWLQSE